MDKSLFTIDKKILSALNSNKPIVALESTLISHGLPFPENVKVAQEAMSPSLPPTESYNAYFGSWESRQ